MSKRYEKISDLDIDRILRLAKGALVAITNSDGTVTNIDLAELAALDSIGADDLAKIDGITNGTGAAGKALVLGASGEASVPGILDLDGNVIATTAGTGITTGTGTVYKSSAQKVGGIIKTSILIDLTGLSSNVLGDIIGKEATANCHIGQITAAVSGTIFGGKVTCLEAPTTGEPDIDIFAADEATGTEDAAVSGLTNSAAIVTAGADWTLGLEKYVTGIPAANQYLYLVGGGGTTDAVYDAGKFLIELYGYDA